MKELGNESINLRLVNIVDELDYAVKLGVLATLGIAINSVLVFTAMPSKNALCKAIQSQLLKQDLK